MHAHGFGKVRKSSTLPAESLAIISHEGRHFGHVVSISIDGLAAFLLSGGACFVGVLADALPSIGTMWCRASSIGVRRPKETDVARGFSLENVACTRNSTAKLSKR